MPDSDLKCEQVYQMNECWSQAISLFLTDGQWGKKKKKWKFRAGDLDQ